MWQTVEAATAAAKRKGRTTMGKALRVITIAQRLACVLVIYAYLELVVLVVVVGEIGVHFTWPMSG